MAETQKDLRRAQEQKERVTEHKEKVKTSRETLGKYFYDLSKLVFGVMVLGIVIPWVSEFGNTNYWIIFGVGLFTTIALANLGNRILKK